MKSLLALLMTLIMFCTSGCSLSGIDLQAASTSDLTISTLKELYSEKKYEEAEKAILEYLETYPNDVVALSLKANILITKGEAEEGLILIDKLLLSDPDNDTLLNNKSWAYNTLGLYTLALKYADMSLKVSAADEYTLGNKAAALYGLSDYAEALLQHQMAIALNDEFPIAYHGKGLCLQQSGNDEDAFYCLKKAFSIAPTDDDYFRDLISSCQKLEKYEAIIEFSNERLSVSPEDPDASYYIAEAMGHLNQSKDALQHYDDLIDTSDYVADAWYEKCKVYLNLNDRENAYKSIKKVLELDKEYFFYIDFNELKILKGYKDFDELTLNYLYETTY